MENSFRCYETQLNLKATELRLGLPGTDETEKPPCNYNSVARSNNKRSSPDASDQEESISKSNIMNNSNGSDATSDVPPAK